MRKFLKFLLVLAIIVAVIYGIFFFALRTTGKKVDVTYSEKDIKSYMEKTGVTFDSNSAGYAEYMTGKFKGVGSKPVEGTVTNSEVTAIVNKTADESGLCKDFAIKFHSDGTMEASFVLDKNLDLLYAMVPEAEKYDNILKLAAGTPVYFKNKIEYLGDNKFQAVTEELYFGRIPLPVDTADKELTPVGTQANKIISQIDGLNIEELSFSDDGLYFKGDIPEAIVVIP